ncbi:MAG: hypothetical protein H8D67_01410 [Deltaproteobacteria bacterium]|nr:hypothetical protein [Deltaproteobacteria bacterium]
MIIFALSMGRAAIKTVNWFLLAIVVLFVCFSLFFACQGDDDKVSVGDPDALVDNLEQDGFVVKEGAAGYFNMIQGCCTPAEEPKLPSCFGFNPDAPYVASGLPDADGQDEPNASGLYDPTMTFSAGYRLAPDEAVVIAGKTPPEVTYFSYVPYLFIRYDPTIGNYVKIFATMTDTINFMNIKTTGTPNGAQGNPFDEDTLIIVTADEETERRVRQAAVTAGYSESIINTIVLPAEFARLGLEAGKDEFIILNRLALPPEDEQAVQAFDDYLETPGVRVFRASPGTDDTTPLA